jgi:hypothetical protein
LTTNNHAGNTEKTEGTSINTNKTKHQTENQQQKQQMTKKQQRDVDNREDIHKALAHIGNESLDNTITKGVMGGLEHIATSKQLEDQGLEIPKRCTHCDAGMGHKQSTRHANSPHQIQPLGPGTAISADVIGPMRPSINGNTLMVVVMCMTTKYMYVRGLKHQRDMHIEFERYRALMKNRDIKHDRVHIGLSKMVTDSAKNLIGEMMQTWQRDHFITDWQSAPYSQNQNMVESKIKSLFGKGIANLNTSGFPFFMAQHMIQMACNAMNNIWVKAINTSSLGLGVFFGRKLLESAICTHRGCP